MKISKMKISYIILVTFSVLLLIFDDPLSGAQPEIFQGRGGFVKLGHLDKPFVKNIRKKDGKILEFFLLDTLTTTF